MEKNLFLFIPIPSIPVFGHPLNPSAHYFSEVPFSQSQSNYGLLGAQIIPTLPRKDRVSRPIGPREGEEK